VARMPTVADVARVAGVSRQTVSNVLNAPDVVAPETRTRVSAVIDDLGYRPHAAARRLRTRASSTIGVRLDPESNGVSGAVLDRYLHQLTACAADRDMRITLFTADTPGDEIAQYGRLLDAAEVDAVVLTGTVDDDPRLDWLAERGVPFVSFGRPWSSTGAEADPTRRWVDVDGLAGTAEATGHLLGRGLERIGFLGWPDGSGSGAERRRGWEQEMRRTLGLAPDDLAAATFTSREAVASARAVVERVIADADLEALVCASDSLALGAMMAVREAGRPRFPVIGFDNTPVAEAVGLSSVDQRLDLVARATIDLLMGTAGSRVVASADLAPDAAAHRLITPELVVRRSSHLTPVDGAGAPGDHYRKEQQ